MTPHLLVRSSVEDGSPPPGLGCLGCAGLLSCSHHSHSRASTPFPGAPGHLSEQEVFSLLQLTLSSHCHLHPPSSVLSSKPDRPMTQEEATPFAFPDRTSCQQPLGSLGSLPCSEGLACHFELCGGHTDILNKSIAKLIFCK